VIGISDLIAYSMATVSASLGKEQTSRETQFNLAFFEAVEGTYHPNHSRGAQCRTIPTSNPTCSTSSQSKPQPSAHEVGLS